MRSAEKFALVLVTVPDLKTARLLAKSALGKRLAACANLVPRIESHYWWQGKLERGSEVLMVFKTSQTKLAALEKCILFAHPYDTPEFLVVRLNKGNERYLGWLTQSMGDARR